MATPLVCTDRIVVEYIVAGFRHKLRQYAVLADAPGPTSTLAKRGGGTGILWSDAAQYMWDVVRSILSSTIAAADARLEHLDGVSWNTVGADTLTGAGTGSAVNLTEQVSWVLRDQAFQFVRVNLYETDQGFVGHDLDGAGLTTALHNITLSWTSNIDPLAPYNWSRGRGGSLIANAGGAVGVTLGQNRSIKRARGYA